MGQVQTANVEWSGSIHPIQGDNYSTRAHLGTYTLFCRYQLMRGNFAVEVVATSESLESAVTVPDQGTAKTVAIKMAIAHYREMGAAFKAAGIDVNDPKWSIEDAVHGTD